MERKTLDGVRNGDSASIKEAVQSISENTPRNELQVLLEYAIEGMIAQNNKGPEGVDVKLELLNLSTSISALYSRDPKFELSNREVELATSYDDISALGLVTPQSILDKVDAKKAVVFRQCNEQAYKHVISVGAAVATKVLTGKAAQIAKACLVNAAVNGGDETRKYATEALEQFMDELRFGASIGMLSEQETQAAKQCFVNVALRDKDEGKRRYAADALKYFISDASVKQILVAIEQTDAEAVKEAAGEALRTIRESNELDGARADWECVLFEYPEGRSPQSIYIDMVFTAVETVLTKTGQEDAEQDVRVAVKQLTGFGASPGPMAELIDEPNMRLITRNVENALVHALVNGDQQLAGEAKAGIRKIGSDRVLSILDRVVERERGQDSTLSAKGTEIRELVTEMQRAKFGYSKPPIPPRTKRTARQPRLQVQ